MRSLPGSLQIPPSPSKFILASHLAWVPGGGVAASGLTEELASDPSCITGGGERARAVSRERFPGRGCSAR